jgi:hypothetical protein
MSDNKQQSLHYFTISNIPLGSFVVDKNVETHRTLLGKVAMDMELIFKQFFVSFTIRNKKATHNIVCHSVKSCLSDKIDNGSGFNVAIRNNFDYVKDLNDSDGKIDLNYRENHSCKFTPMLVFKFLANHY